MRSARTVLLYERSPPTHALSRDCSVRFDSAEIAFCRRSCYDYRQFCWLFEISDDFGGLPLKKPTQRQLRRLFFVAALVIGRAHSLLKGDDALLIPAGVSRPPCPGLHDSYKSYREEYRARGCPPTSCAALEYSIFPKYSS